MPMLAALMMLQGAACPAGAEPVPPALSNWGQGTPVSAAADANAPTIAIGMPAEVELLTRVPIYLDGAPQPLDYSITYGGTVAFDLARAGRVSVSASNASRIDIRSGEALIPSVGHRHGPRCSGIRKIVDFDVPAGRHLIQLSGSPAASVRLMVVPAA